MKTQTLKRQVVEPNLEQLLTSLFIKASLQYPTNISGQGLWLTLLFQQGQAEGRINKRVRLYNLKDAMTAETKGVVLEIIAQAAQQAHRHLKKEPSLSLQKVEQIVTEVLKVSFRCQSFDQRQLHALLEMLPIYMQVTKHVSGNDVVDAQNPELLTRKALMKDIVYQTFGGDIQLHIMQRVDEILFSRMVKSHNYVDERFRIFLSVVSLRPRVRM